MRYKKMLIVLLGLTLAACAVTPIAPTELPAPAVATSIPTSQPPATVSPSTLAPTEAPTSEPAPATVEPTSEPAPATVAPTSEPPTVAPTTEPTPRLLTGTFVNGEVTVAGSYILDVDHLTLTLSDDFRVDSGPDLLVVLSGVGDLSLDWQTFSAQALSAPLLRLGALIRFTGAQTYALPPDTGLAVYQSVVIWCNTFSVEFAAASLKP